ncbi:zwei Ig domain protein zig-8 isoform X2 [Cherax quadricarinatus]|uniref:zwei Ig domain protein zig-8 isoform X2 n=1 Tax=Cherax quadricarinatus TaxID=27406 RepID=UPI0023784CC2|nr:zwei Ig domain protein zig-8-like isoform X2 [Cherax quadricarinatus]
MNVTLLVVALAVGGAGGQGLIPPPPLVTDQPYFDSSMLTNQTAHVGRQAELHCRVHSIGNRTVSWIRGRDLRILTVGRYTYTTDLRYESLHQEGTNQWTLRIKSTQPRDQGTYECQISTKPIKAFTIYLRVLEPRGEILGSPDLYVQKGSMINLTCILYDLPEPPAYVLWYHENKSFSYSSSRGGVSIILEKGPTTISYLLLTSARLADTGMYTCAASNLNTTSVMLHVLDGEEPAAMQKNHSLPHSRHLPTPAGGGYPVPVQANNNSSTSSITSSSNSSSSNTSCSIRSPSRVSRMLTRLAVSAILLRVHFPIWPDPT